MDGPDAIVAWLMSTGLRPFLARLASDEQPVFLDRGLFQGERYAVTERISRQGLYLPSGLALTEAQLATVSDAVHEVLAS